MRTMHALPRNSVLLLAFVCLGLSSCLGDGDGNGNVGTNGPAQCEGDAQVALDRARSELERALFEELNADPDPERPADVDFTTAYGLYQQAHSLCTASLDARLGLAVTGLLVLSSDSEINAAFDEWKQYLQTHTPFEVNSSARKPLGIPIGFSSGREAMRLPFEIVPLSVLTFGRPGVLQDAPTIGRIQAILRDRVIPRLQDALTHLGVVGEDPGYVFTVTPRMQGDVDADPAEMDQTDILALRAGASLLIAACRIAVSYNFELAPYDSVTLHQALQRGSNWLQLYPDGHAQMQNALNAIEGAIDDIEASLISLLNESDIQDDDIIKIGPDDLSRSDVDSVLANVPNARRALNEGYTRVDDWDDDETTPDIPLKINVGSLFRAPVNNWKELLPAYEASVERRVDGSNTHFSDNRTETLSVDVPASGWYSAYVSVYRSDDGEESIYFWGDDFLRIPMEQALRTAITALKLPQCLSYLNASMNFNGNLNAGMQDVSASMWLNWAEGTCVVVPVITWDADTFEQWEWPSPDMNGLLPDIRSTAQLMSTFGIQAFQWEKRWVLDWTDEF